MQSKAYKRGTEISIMQIKDIAELKGFIIVRTITGETMYPAFELLYWQLRNLLSVKLFVAVKCYSKSIKYVQ